VPAPTIVPTAAPLIRIPLHPVETPADAEADGNVEASPGLPYDNATFSADSADETSGSEAGGFGQRVLTIDQLHAVLGEDPGLAQRLLTERERERAGEAAGGSPRGTAPQVPRRPVRPLGGGGSSSGGSSAPNTPARPCEAVVAEAEAAGSPLRLRPAQRELMQVRARGVGEAICPLCARMHVLTASADHGPAWVAGELTARGCVIVCLPAAPHV
jgi:hypothetical protein